MRSYATRQITIGLVIAAVGGLISLGSYQSASESGGGGYVVFWGAVVFGLLKAFRGARLYVASGPEFSRLPSTSQSRGPMFGTPSPPAPTPPVPISAGEDLGSRIKLGPTRQPELPEG